MKKVNAKLKKHVPRNIFALGLSIMAQKRCVMGACWLIFLKIDQLGQDKIHFFQYFLGKIIFQHFADANVELLLW